MTRVIIVGGGFGGIYAARELSKRLGRKDELLLFEPNDHFVFTPLLHEVAGGVLNLDGVTVSYERMLKRHCRIRHIRQKVTRIELETRKVTAGKKKYPFDYVVIAPGATTNFYGHKYPVLTLKNARDALLIRSSVEQNVRRAARMLRKNPKADVGSLLHCAIIGGGPTGVELAGELVDFYAFRAKREGIARKTRVTLLQSRDTLLPSYSKDVRHKASDILEKRGVKIIVETYVKSIVKNAITTVGAGRGITTLNASCIIWTAGITPNTIRTSKIHNPYFHVTSTLQLNDCPYAFALGDVSLLKPRVPALAQAATQQGLHASRNIIRRIKGKELLPFTFRKKGSIVSVGQRYAVGEMLGMAVSGFHAWFVMRTVYLFKFQDFKQELKTAVMYTKHLFRIHDGNLIDVDREMASLREKK